MINTASPRSSRESSCRAKFYDEPFANPVLSSSIFNAIAEGARKVQLLSQCRDLCGTGALLVCQLDRKEAILRYAQENYTQEAIQAALCA